MENCSRILIISTLHIYSILCQIFMALPNIFVGIDFHIFDQEYLVPVSGIKIPSSTLVLYCILDFLYVDFRKSETTCPYGC